MTSVKDMREIQVERISSTLLPVVVRYEEVRAIAAIRAAFARHPILSDGFCRFGGATAEPSLDEMIATSEED